jgi:nucleoside-diphosphate-sugar epimerase
MRAALVTGSAGFVGRHLVPVLQTAGFDVVGIDPNSEDKTPEYKNCESLWTYLDRRRFDVVVHLAANIEGIDKRVAGGAIQFADAVLDYKMARWLELQPHGLYIHMTSCAVSAPAPEDPYCSVKRFGEEMLMHTCKQAGIPAVFFRPYSGYGTDQSEAYPFGAILARALRGEDPLTVWGSNGTVRDFVHIDDIVSAIMDAVDGKLPTYIPIEVGTGVGTRLGDLAKMIAVAVGYKPQITVDESKPVGAAVRVMDPSTVTCGGRGKVAGYLGSITVEDGIACAVRERRQQLAQTP